eukprot:104998_1
MDKHLKENETEHLKMKVNAVENELMLVKEENKKIMEDNKTQSEHLKSMKQTNKDQEMRVQYLEMLQTMNNKDKLLLLLKSKNAYICGIQSGKKQKVEIRSFMNEGYGQYCMGNDIGFSAGKQIGFDAKDINVIGNDIVFGLSNTEISAVGLKTKACKIFTGNISFDSWVPIYCNKYGLMVVGGQSVNDETIANNKICKIRFNNDKFTTQTVTKLPYSATNPSVCMINDNNNNKLFVCGGWWNGYNLSKCYLYSFNNEWKELKSMNHCHQLGGICVWKERGNNIIVGGGYTDNKYVEEYDIHKNKWIDLPNLNEKHTTYPALITSNNILFCIGGVICGDINLGCVEFYDPRDRSNKWIYVDTVQNYFNINQDSGAGFNCFLPL